MSAPFPDDFSIDLPDLEESDASAEIVADNIRAVQMLYFAAMLEETKFFQVVDRLVELFAAGRLPLGRGNAAGRLYQYWKHQSARLTEAERRTMYACTFGFPGGKSEAQPNLEFGDLWMRFVAAVSEYGNQAERDDGVLQAGRALGKNLSAHGSGLAYYAAREMQTQIKEAMAILSDPEIEAAYGAKDVWGVVEHVSEGEFCAHTNSIRRRTMASSGVAIMDWIARQRRRLAAPCGTPGAWPLGGELIEACDAWLAAASGGRSKMMDGPSAK